MMILIEKIDNKYGIYQCEECKLNYKRQHQNIQNGGKRCRESWKKQQKIEGGKNFYKHGLTRRNKIVSEFYCWVGMLQRCYNEKCKAYKDYGGRGITVCPEWRDNFEQFYNDMGPRPSKKYSIDRKNNNGNYELSNCRWAIKSEQNSNTRYNTILHWNGQDYILKNLASLYNIKSCTLSYRLHKLNWSLEKSLNTPTQITITFNGETKTLKEWSKHFQIEYKTLFDRIYYLKWSIEKSFTTPSRKKVHG